MASNTSLRILMFPWLAHGHVSPFLQLSNKLSKSNFHIYFCSTPINLQLIKKNPSYHQIEPIELHLPTLPPHYQTNKNIPPHLMPHLLHAFQMSSSDFASIVAKIKPDLIVYDGFQPWAAKIAAAEGIPAVFFSITNTASLAFFHHMYSYKNCGTFPFDSVWLRDYEKRDLIEQVKYMEMEGMDEGFAFGVLRLSREFVLVKSCKGIEEKYANYLSKLCEKKILFTGPLVRVSDERESEGLEIIKWLSEREKFSTLYISFGSENYLSSEQMVEIAKGLEEVEVNFIWVARAAEGSAAAPPLGFAERVKGRGLVVDTWVPQAAILAHGSVGGFMTHCGWSSISESVYFRVPVVALPLKYDQTVNARLAVEGGIGMEVERGENGGFGGAAVAKAVREVVVEGGEGFRRRVGEWRKKMVMEEEEDIEGVVKELTRICMKK